MKGGGGIKPKGVVEILGLGDRAPLSSPRRRGTPLPDPHGGDARHGGGWLASGSY